MGYLTMLFLTTTIQLNLPPNLLQSICYIESKHKVNAIHLNDGVGHSLGVCQIKLKTAKWLGFTGTEKQLMDPKTNIWYAGLYLRYQLLRYRSPIKAVIAYNIGHAHLTSTKYQARVFEEWRQYDAINRRDYSRFERRP